jgi:hypothetical protein
MVTENGGLTRTAALRVGCWIRGALALASQREVAETLLAVNYLGLVETQRSGDFTCRIGGRAGGRGYWDAAQQSIDDTLHLVRQAVDSRDVEHISVFAIAPIPLLVYLGWQLDGKTPTRVFQKQRDQFVGWSWADQSDPIDFAVLGPEADTAAEEVVLLCSVTSDVNPELLPTAISGFPRIGVRPDQVHCAEQSAASYRVEGRDEPPSAELSRVTPDAGGGLGCDRAQDPNPISFCAFRPRRH